MSSISIGQSWHANAYLAGREAVQQAVINLRTANLARCGGIALAVVSASPAYAQESLMLGIRQALGTSVPIVGSTSSQQFTMSGVSVESVVVMLIESGPRLSVKPLLFAHRHRPHPDLARHITEEVSRFIPAMDGLPMRVVQVDGQVLAVRPYSLFFFGAGHGNEFSRLLNKVGHDLGPAVQVIGATTGDAVDSPNGYQYLNGHIYRNALVGFLLVSRAPMAIGHTAHPTSCKEADGGWPGHTPRNMPPDENLESLLGLTRVAAGKRPTSHTSPLFGRPDAHVAPEIAASKQRIRNVLSVSDVWRSMTGWAGSPPPKANRPPGYAPVQSNARGPSPDLYPPGTSVASAPWDNPAIRDRIYAAYQSAQRAVGALGTARPQAAILLIASQGLLDQDASTLALELLAIRNVIGLRVPLLGLSMAHSVIASRQSSAVVCAQSSVLCLIGA